MLAALRSSCAARARRSAPAIRRRAPLEALPGRRVLTALGAIALAAGARGALAEPPRAGAGPAAGVERVWIELREPVPRPRVELPIPLLEIRGAAGAGRGRAHDVVIAVDLSSSTRLPSGVDVDADGRTGRSAPWIREDYWGTGSPEELCDDPDDTIAAAEIAAVRRLLELLDPARTRVGLVAFGDRAEPVAPVGSRRDRLERALTQLEARQGQYGATDYGAAVRAALDSLPASAEGRSRSVLFLSDGVPTLPVPEPAPRERALDEASHAAQRAVRLFTFALGPEAVRGRETLDTMARRTHGEHVALERPGDVLFDLPYVDLSRIRAVELRNATSGEAGRAIRLFADGSFDGFVPLVPGANRIEIHVTSAGGTRAELARTIEYAPLELDPRGLALEKAELQRLLRERTREVELATEMRRERRSPRSASRSAVRVETIEDSSTDPRPPGSASARPPVGRDDPE